MGAKNLVVVVGLVVAIVGVVTVMGQRPPPSYDLDGVVDYQNPDYKIIQRPIVRRTTTTKKTGSTTTKTTTTTTSPFAMKPRVAIQQSDPMQSSNYPDTYGDYNPDNYGGPPVKPTAAKPTTKKQTAKTTVKATTAKKTTAKAITGKSTTKKLTTKLGGMKPTKLTTTRSPDATQKPARLTARTNKPLLSRTTPDYDNYEAYDYNDNGDYVTPQQAIRADPSVTKATTKKPATLLPANRVLSVKCGQNGIQGAHILCQANSPNLVGIEPVAKDLIVTVHNWWRSNYLKPNPRKGLSKLVWDDDLAAVAERYAAQCNGDHSKPETRKLHYRTSSSGAAWDNIGETMCMSNNPFESPLDCIDNWAYERFYWKYGVGKVDNSKSVSNYAQLIRQETAAVGCAKSRCKNSAYKTVTVCMYDVGGDSVNRIGDNAVSKPYDV